MIRVFLVAWIVTGLNPARAGAVGSLSVSGGGLERRTRAERARRRSRVRARGRDAQRPHAPAGRGRAVPEVGPLANENGELAWIHGPGRKQGRALGAQALGRQEQGCLRAPRASRKSSISFFRIVGSMFVRVNLMCAHRLRPPARPSAGTAAGRFDSSLARLRGLGVHRSSMR